MIKEFISNPHDKKLIARCRKIDGKQCIAHELVEGYELYLDVRLELQDSLNFSLDPPVLIRLLKVARP